LNNDDRGAGLFLGILNWGGGYRQMWGGAVNMRKAQIYIKNYFKNEKITLRGGG